MQSADSTEADSPELDALMQDKLEAHCRQQLSAMLDGSLAPDQARFLLRRLQHDHELAGCWERWQVYGDLMRGGAHALLPSDFSQRVAAALAEEGEHAAAAMPAAVRAGWTRWAGGAALAASVAVAALFVVQRQPSPVAADGARQASSASAPASPPEAARLVAQSAPSSASPAATVREPAGAPRPAPGPLQAGAAVATVALAAAETPRRAARRARAQTAPAGRMAAEPPARPGTSEPDLVAAAEARVDAAAALTGPAAPQPALAAAGEREDPFAGAGLPVARPWPRAVVPGMGGSALNVDYGDAAPAYEHFQPRLPVDEPSPAP